MAGARYQRLIRDLRTMEGAAVAFSGGVDSTLLLHAGQQALGNHVVALTASTPYMAGPEIQQARELAARFGVRHVVLELPFPEALRTNPADHCYPCKKYLFTRLWQATRELGLGHLLDGTNLDDLDDYRPGLRALAELGVSSPLRQAGLTKEDIRALSHREGLPTWNKPPMACLLSRMPANHYVNDADLRRVEAAETFLMEQGFPWVRVRVHDDAARIEIPRDRLSDMLQGSLPHRVDTRLRTLGFRHVSLDLAGYRTGSLNSTKK
ncbi:MAG: ATP-dependent sacrificial sulfur transferase LarE [Desulfovibrio sp.]